MFIWGNYMDDEKIEKIRDYEEEIKFKDLLIEILNDKVEMERSKYKSM